MRPVTRSSVRPPAQLRQLRLAADVHRQWDCDFNCVTAGNYSLPAKRSGGYCLEASAGKYSYAYFSTF